MIGFHSKNTVHRSVDLLFFSPFVDIEENGIPPTSRCLKLRNQALKQKVSLLLMQLGAQRFSRIQWGSQFSKHVRDGSLGQHTDFDRAQIGPVGVIPLQL